MPETTHDAVIRWIIREEVDYQLDLSRAEIIEHFAGCTLHDGSRLADAGTVAAMTPDQLAMFVQSAYEASQHPNSDLATTFAFAELEDQANNNGEVQGSLRNFVPIEIDVAGNDISADPHTLLGYAEDVEERGHVLLEAERFSTPASQARIAEEDGSTRENRLLTILLDPANDPVAPDTTAEAIRDELEGFTGCDISEARDVASRLREFYARRHGRLGAFEMDIACDADGVADSFTVMTMLDSGLWLSVTEDSKYLFGDRYGLTGLDAAVRIAENIDREYERLIDGRSRVILTEKPFANAD